jgi:predicted RecA/RadA family phage recombinase
MATYRADGDKVDYTPTTGVAAGTEVVIGTVVGVVDRPIVANQLGAACVKGVFAFAKPTGAGTNYAQGAAVYWTGTQMVTGVTGTKAGIVARQPATTDTTIDVLIFPGA